MNKLSLVSPSIKTDPNPSHLDGGVWDKYFIYEDEIPHSGILLKKT